MPVACLAGLAAVGLLILSDVPTPSLVVDTDALTSSRRLDVLVASALDDEFEAELGPAAYLHCRVAAVQRQRELYTKDASYALANLDASLPAGGAYLSMGLNNDYDASYYWARHCGVNCRRAVPGIGLRSGEGGLTEVFRLTEEEARAQGRLQPNDGKWSEVRASKRTRTRVRMRTLARTHTRGRAEVAPALRRATAVVRVPQGRRPGRPGARLGARGAPRGRWARLRHLARRSPPRGRAGGGGDVDVAGHCWAADERGGWARLRGRTVGVFSALGETSGTGTAPTVKFLKYMRGCSRSNARP